MAKRKTKSGPARRHPPRAPATAGDDTVITALGLPLQLYVPFWADAFVTRFNMTESTAFRGTKARDGGGTNDSSGREASQIRPALLPEASRPSAARFRDARARPRFIAHVAARADPPAAPH